MKNKAFTLVELLAAVMILIVILLVSAPTIKKIVDGSNCLSTESAKERVIDAAKEYTTLYNKGILNSLIEIGDNKYISINSLIKLGLIKNGDVSVLDENSYIKLTLDYNHLVSYSIENDESITVSDGEYIALLGTNPYYLLQNTNYYDQGYVAFDSVGNNVSNKIEISGQNFDTSALGKHTITYSLKDSSGNVIATTTRDVFVVDSIYPRVTEAVITSNNVYNNKKAKNENVITLQLTFSKWVTTPTVTIGGRTATVSGSKDTRTATYTIPVDENTLNEGELQISVTNYQDTYRNAGVTASNITSGGLVVYDRTAPTVTTTSIVSNNSNNKLSKNGNTITLNATFSETVVDSTMTIGGRTATVSGSGNSKSGSYLIPIGESSISEGNLSINISNYIDEVGNVGTSFSTITTGGNVLYDRTAPTCSSSGGSTTWRSTNLTLTGTCSDSGSGCAGNVSKTYSTEINSTTESPGIVNDNAGNSAMCPGDQIVKIDKTAPTCISSGGSAIWRNTNLTLTGTCSDSGSGCAGNASKTYSTEINSTTESPGTVSDTVGNSATCPGDQTVKIDKTAPSLTIPSDMTLLVSQVASFNSMTGVSSTDANSTPTVNVSGTVNASVGTYILTYTSTDGAGNQTVKTRTISVISGVYTFNYTGASQSFTVSLTGNYQLQLWGAEGGSSTASGTIGGKGGYATGNISLTKDQVIYVYVGGKGAVTSSSTTTNYAGGWNGGGTAVGNATASYRCGTGGGASDIRIGGTALSNRVIVAGGGGGSGGRYNNYYGGAGGGTTGITGSSGTSSGTGGSSTAGGTTGGASGIGGAGTTISRGGGGGGYYGGGSARADYYGGGGGSSYTGGVTSGSTIAGNASMPNPSGGNMTGRAGDGIVIITLLP